MAEKQNSRETKEELSELLAWERQAIAGQVSRLRSRFDVKQRFRSFLARKPAVVLGTAVAGGFVLVRILTAPRHEKDPDSAATKTGRFAILIGGLVAVIKPAVQDFVVAQTKKELNRRFYGANPSSSTLKLDIPADRVTNSPRP